MSIQFRVFDEEQSEASVDLEENKIYRVGNSMQFDIFLGASQNSQDGTSYFDFSIAGNVITFSQSSGNVTYIDFLNHSRNIIDSSYTYEVPCLFEFIGVNFAICEESDSWEKWRSYIKAGHAKEDQNINMSPSELAQLESIVSRADNPNASSTPPSFLQNPVGYLKSKNFLPNLDNFISPKNKKVFFITFIGGFLLIVLVVAFSIVSKYSLQHALQNQQAASISDIQSIKQIEVNLPTRFNNLKFISNQSDMVVIMGVVKNQEDIIYIQKRFERFKKIVTFKLLTADQAINKLTLLLKSQKIYLVTPEFNNTTYRLYLIGLLPNLDALNDIELAVSNQIPEVSDLDTTQVFALADVDKDVDDLVSKNNLSARLTVKKNLNARTVDIGGYLNQSEIIELKNNVTDLMTKYQGLIQIKLDVKDARSSLPFKIVAVTTGGFPSFMTDDGRKVFEGSEIDGMKVDKISSSEIVFSGKFPLVFKLEDIGAGPASSKQ